MAWTRTVGCCNSLRHTHIRKHPLCFDDNSLCRADFFTWYLRKDFKHVTNFQILLLITIVTVSWNATHSLLANSPYCAASFRGFSTQAFILGSILFSSKHAIHKTLIFPSKKDFFFALFGETLNVFGHDRFCHFPKTKTRHVRQQTSKQWFETQDDKVEGVYVLPRFSHSSRLRMA